MSIRKAAYVAFAAALNPASPLAGQQIASPNFPLRCGVGTKRVEIIIQNGRLVYRFGTRLLTELEIKERRDIPNLFYRYNILGTKGGGQQLRFTKGRYSYGLSSWFIARPGGADEGMAYFVLRDDKLLKWRKCEGNDWFEEDRQLERLPLDFFIVRPEGVSTRKVIGVRLPASRESEPSDKSGGEPALNPSTMQAIGQACR